MKTSILKKSALLVIDMQRYFLQPKAPAYLEGAPRIVPNIKLLIDSFRNAGLPVVFTRHAHKKGEPANQMRRWWGDELPWEGDRYAEIIKELVPRDDEIVITKTRYSAFEETELDLALRRQGIAAVVLCGVMTNLCVETTARHAFMKDLQPIVVEDACATKRDDYHDASILNLAYGFAFIERADRLIDKLNTAHFKIRSS